jgi:hypothetical protein
VELNLITAAKNNGDGTYDAEIALAILADDYSLVGGTQQRTVSRGHTDRESARNAAIEWARKNLCPVIEKLPKAKP